MEITLQLFGAFRPFGDNLKLSLKNGAKVFDIRESLKQKIDVAEGLIKSSRFANEIEVLAEDTNLRDGDIVAIIPPVSGG